MGGLILPNTLVEKIDCPLIFLAGPIMCAPNWQDEAVNIILKREPGFTVASPRGDIREKIAKYVLSGSDAFSRQRAWELHYLHFAAKAGAIMFWLPGEAKHSCQKVYGAMTRVEIGEWLIQYSHDNSVRFCIGTDGRFPEFSPIKHDINHYAPNKIIQETLESTCSEAIRIAKQ